MTYEHSYKEPSTAGSGLGEIGGMVALALVVMALLTFGYRGHSGTETAKTQSVPMAASPADQMSVPAQPRANGANTPAAPTTSTTGVGASNGTN